MDRVNSVSPDEIVSSENFTILETCCIWSGNLCPCFNFYNVNANMESVNFYFGKYYDTKYSGLRYNSCIGLERIDIPVNEVVLQVPAIKILDLEGNPIIISAIINYKITNSVNFYLTTKGDYSRIKLQGEAAIRNISVKYPFISHNGENSLKDSRDLIGQEFKVELQKHVNNWGITINNVQIVDLSYSAEIAQQMLAVQQATATMRARKIIIDNAVEMVRGVVNDLGKDLIKPEDISSLANNLIVVMAGNNHATPVINMNR